MASVIWSPLALEQLERICQYIAQDAPRVAPIFAQRVFHAVDRLALFPGSGRVVPERQSSNVREVIVQRYRVLFRIRDDCVDILAIYHGARRLPPEES